MDPRSLAAEAVVRILLLSRAVDAGYRLFERGRSELVAALASDAALERFNDLAYGRDGFYHPDAASFRGELFPWEERAFAAHLPEPPAGVLVGGAGGGREAFALLERGYTVVAFDHGYTVVAFDPAAELVRSMAAARRPEGSLVVLVGA